MPELTEKVVRLRPSEIAQRNLRQADAGLADSIRKNGLLQPPLVIATDDGYLLYDGHRRLAAWQAVHGDDPLPCAILDPGDVPRQAIQLVANTHRQDLNPIDEATAMEELITEQGMAVGEVADLLGVHYTHISARRRLLRLADPLRQAVATGILSPSAGEEAARMPVDAQEMLSGEIIAAKTVSNIAAITSATLAAEEEQGEADGDLVSQLEPDRIEHQEIPSLDIAALQMAIAALYQVSTPDQDLKEVHQKLQHLLARWQGQLVPCPADKGEGDDHFFCAWCDGSGETSPERAAEYERQFTAQESEVGDLIAQERDWKREALTLS